MPENWQEAGFGLYVHWPFCQSKCPYCDFNSHVQKNVDQEVFKRALIAEITCYAELLPDRVLSSVFFGGGTPSLMEPGVVEGVLHAASQHWTFANDIEITLEANPTSVEAGRFSGYASAGVNRISVGVQAMDDADLIRLGRLHSVVDAMSAIDTATRHFSRVSMDLIYARMDQTAANWEQELRGALALGLDHYALYQLTVEDGTAFGDRFRRGKLRGLPDEDLSVDLWSVTQSLCEDAGIERYEVSNHARMSQESRHNEIYWRSGDWVGVGPGAHGRLTIDGTRFGTERTRAPSVWLDEIESTVSAGLVPISHSEWRDEAVLMGLRTREGLDLKRLSRFLPDLLSFDFSSFEACGLMVRCTDRVAATEQGILVLNALISEILDS